VRSDSRITSSLIRALEARFRHRGCLRARFVQKNFHGDRIHFRRRGGALPCARVCVHECARVIELRKHNHQEMPIRRAFLALGKNRDDVDAIARHLRARLSDHADDPGATSLARAAIVLTSSTRFGFFHLLRY
jgi:hypothetical protein